jgi:serine/threonine protein kinase
MPHGSRKESNPLSENSVYEERRIGGYRLLSLLGRGGFGDVYLGEQIRDHSQVAIKILHNAGLTHPEDVKEFINEARMFRLQHPHIVPVLDFGVDRDDTPFLVMQYAAHGTLRQRHAPGTQLSPQLVADYVSQIASALQYAHDQQIIHRDVKPENMLLNSDDQVMLSDFGIAAAIHSTPSSDQSKNIDGTVYYIAPEQIQGVPCPASDQYALGIVAYEWLVGHSPFEGSTPLEIGMRHLTSTPPSLCEQVPSLSPQIDAVILKALAKNPDDRFPSIQAFADALQQATADSPQQVAQTQDTQSFAKVPTHRLSSHRLVSLDNSAQLSPPETPVSLETPHAQPPIESEPITITTTKDETVTTIITTAEGEQATPITITTEDETATASIMTENETVTASTMTEGATDAPDATIATTTTEGEQATPGAATASTAEGETVTATPTEPPAASPQPEPSLRLRLARHLLIPATLLLACILIIGSVSVPFARNNLQDGSIRAPVNGLHAIEAHTPDYQDTLTDARNKATIAAFWNNYDGCRLSSSGYLVYSTKGRQVCHELGKSYTNFAIQINMTIITGIAGAFVFRDQDAVHSYGGYIFEVFSDGHYLISNFDHILYAAASPAIKSGFMTTNKLAVIAGGSHLSFFINDTFLIQMTDTTYTRGPFSLAALQGGYPNCSVNFSDISVWAIP